LDSSALVEAIIATPAAVAAFDAEHERVTRAHTLAETFSQLTKGTLKNDQGETIALLADDAAKTIEAWAGRMTMSRSTESRFSPRSSKLRRKAFAAARCMTISTSLQPKLKAPTKSTR
jgi:hypothetical protein